MDRPALIRVAAVLGGLVLVLLSLAAPGAAQTISGTLRDSESRQAIPLGLVLMYSEAGDSVTSTVADAGGRFEVSSTEPGSYLLRAAALGYRETPVGVFELGEGGSITIEYLLKAAPLPMDALMVEIDRPVLDHHLVRNGYVRRLQRGLGKFITPFDIENSSARSTESLMEGIPGVRVGIVTANTGGVRMPAPHLGQTVQIAGPHGGWCEPTIYLDGIRTQYDPEMGFTLSQVAHLETVEAVEIYRRAAEIPVEFGVAQGAGDLRSGGGTTGCGVLAVWTKQGLAPGQRAEFSAPATAAVPEQQTLPDVPFNDSQLRPGEEVRLQLDREVAEAQGFSVLPEGAFSTMGPDAIVVREARTDRPLSIPLSAIEEVQVSRPKGSLDAWRRGAIAGGVAAAGTAGFLTLLCEFTCRGDPNQAVALPSLGLGVLIGALVWSQGPGTEWVRAPMPDTESSFGRRGR